MSRVDEINEFFKHDINIKNTMKDMAPNEAYIYDRNYVYTYFDHVYKSINYMHDEFMDIADMYYDNYTIECIENFFKKIVEELLIAGYDGDKLRAFYDKRITYMRPEFNAKVSQTLKGYYLSRDISFTIREAKTLNEMLHSMHANIVNDDLLYRCSGELDKVRTIQQCSIHLYGNETVLGRGIFDIFATAGVKEADEVLIISVNENKVLVMTRGLGHATTFEIDRTDQGDLRVSYFIPKVCSVPMVNALKGINPVPELQPVFAGATGRFYTTDEAFTNEFTNLLFGIPTDDDLYKDPTRRERV